MAFFNSLYQAVSKNRDTYRYTESTLYIYPNFSKRYHNAKTGKGNRDDCSKRQRNVVWSPLDVEMMGESSTSIFPVGQRQE